MIYSYFSLFITALLSYSLVLSTFLSWAQSSTSEPIGWIGCNDRLTNCERRNTKGSVSLHQPCMTSSLCRRVNSHYGDDNRQIRLLLSLSLSLTHLISQLLKKKFILLIWVHLDSYQDVPQFRREKERTEWVSEWEGRSGETQSDSGSI